MLWHKEYHSHVCNINKNLSCEQLARHIFTSKAISLIIIIIGEGAWDEHDIYESITNIANNVSGSASGRCAFFALLYW